MISFERLEIDLTGKATWAGDEHYPTVQAESQKVTIYIDDIELSISRVTAEYLLNNLADKLDKKAVEMTERELAERAEAIRQAQIEHLKQTDEAIKNYRARQGKK